MKNNAEIIIQTAKPKTASSIRNDQVFHVQSGKTEALTNPLQK